MYNRSPWSILDQHQEPAQHPLTPDYMGGLAWSKGFERYMRGVLPESVRRAREEEERARREWYSNPYVLRQLKKEHGVSEEELRILKDLLSTREPYRDQSRKWGKSIQWLKELRVRVTRIVRTRYLPPRHHGQKPGTIEDSGEPVQATKT